MTKLEKSGTVSSPATAGMPVTVGKQGRSVRAGTVDGVIGKQQKQEVKPEQGRQ